MPHSTNWKSAKSKLSGSRNSFPVSTEAAVHPHKNSVGHYILLLVSDVWSVPFRKKRQTVVQDGDSISTEQYSSTPGRTFGRTLPMIFWEGEFLSLYLKKKECVPF